MLSEEILINRLNELIEKGNNLKTKTQSFYQKGIGATWIDREFFYKWKINSIAYLERNFFRTSYYNGFNSGVGASVEMSLETGLGVLKALKEDIEKGYLTRYRTLVIADVFTDFLEMAEHLLENNYKHPAASLIGAVLENGLRKICDNHNITVKSKDNIGSLNRKLADKKTYTRIVQRKIEVWNKIRDYADHGHFKEYKKEEVEEMFKGVSNFLLNYLKD